MTEETTAPMGRLRIDVQSNSYLLRNILAIEVRDSRMKLIKTMAPGENLELDNGLYQVSAVLEDGKRHSRVVQMQSGAEESVVLGAGEARGGAKSVDGGAEDSAPASSANLIELSGARVVAESEGAWRFQPDDSAFASVPRAQFAVAGRFLEVSLPVNPEGYGPESACEVRVTPRRAGPELRAWIAPERTVASALQHMLASGYMLQAAKVAGEATELLRGKYQDPTGAALGALVLQKVGALEKRLSWLENLARDFAWMPDAKVLLALTLAKNKQTQERVEQLVLSASQKPMMFTESYSLLLNLLRRWPWKNESPSRTAGLEALTKTAPYTEWEAITWTHWLPEED